MNSRSKNILINILKSLPVALFALGLSNCSSNVDSVVVKKTDGFQPSHGPFDSNGNYVENWADDAPKRKYVAAKPSKSTTKKSTASTSSTSNNKSSSSFFGSSPKAAPTPSPSSTPKPSSVASYKPVAPTQTYTPSRTTTPTPSKPTYTPKKTTVKATPKPSKPTPKKITPKSKPPIIHTVVKGDTLYGLARKYGASISDIQTANRLSGTSISLGKRLIIPRK
ncbi:MAG: LysM peptidoglycan-binding domain-containing protein [Akkermansiaceae bacterium]